MYNLTGKEIAASGIVTNVTDECIAQHGIDLQLIEVKRLDGFVNSGFIPQEGKTQLCHRVLIEHGVSEEMPDKDVWILNPGQYDITFKQGCKIPVDKLALIRQRSSMLRNGTILHSSVFDAGYECLQIGTVLFVFQRIVIEYGARVAQMYVHNSNVVENLYNGQFQGK